ncbi:type II secretion system minor pseudopilin GspK [Chitinivorax sp. PXF-14]|uniref:type II secretion system minor pseudopilin GspK n=1 Tax=Chitinivorax sp. PXF-14 TaxID=3230488 RepID=UPI003465E130
MIRHSGRQPSLHKRREPSARAVGRPAAGPARQRGVAIITAVLVVALVASMTFFMAWREQLWIRVVENQTDAAEAKAIARAALNLVRASLRDDGRPNNGQPPYDHPGEAWAVPITKMPVERGEAGGQVVDQQGLFNLNSLVKQETQGQDQAAYVKNPPGFDQFVALLGRLQLPQSLALTLLDWLDSGNEPVTGGAEEMDYLNLDHPYRPPNQPIVDFAELKRVKGFTPEAMAKLRPFVTVLPLSQAAEEGRININFAPAEVLAGINGIGDAGASLIVQKRREKPFASVDEVKALFQDPQGTPIDETAIGVRTYFFEARVSARFGRVAVTYTALLKRDSSNKVSVIWLKQL